MRPGQTDTKATPKRSQTSSKPTPNGRRTDTKPTPNQPPVPVASGQQIADSRWQACLERGRRARGWRGSTARRRVARESRHGDGERRQTSSCSFPRGHAARADAPAAPRSTIPVALRKAVRRCATAQRTWRFFGERRRILRAGVNDLRNGTKARRSIAQSEVRAAEATERRRGGEGVEAWASASSFSRAAAVGARRRQVCPF